MRISDYICRAGSPSDPSGTLLNAGAAGMCFSTCLRMTAPPVAISSADDHSATPFSNPHGWPSRFLQAQACGCRRHVLLNMPANDSSSGRNTFPDGHCATPFSYSHGCPSGFLQAQACKKRMPAAPRSIFCATWRPQTRYRFMPDRKPALQRSPSPSTPIAFLC